MTPLEKAQDLVNKHSVNNALIIANEVVYILNDECPSKTDFWGAVKVFLEKYLCNTIKKAEYNKKAYDYNRPFPFRLGSLRLLMQRDAFHNPELLGDCIHAVGVNIIKNHYHKREVVQEVWLQKLIETSNISRDNIKNHIPLRKYGSRVKDHPTLF